MNDTPVDLPKPERFGKYLLLRQVAVGGMAEIFLALEQLPSGGRRFVTIKRIRPDLATDPDFVEFFLSEGHLALKCSHPNLPHALTLGDVDGVHFQAMEYIHGHTLLEIVRRAYRAHRPLSAATAARIGVEVATALEYAHSLTDVDGKPLGIIHRDVTPQNIMVSAAGGVTLIDFGIARFDRQLHQTKVGTIKGKFSYMAPEQLTNNNQLDQRVDIFSVGICLHETLTGRSLFRGTDDAETLRNVRNHEIPNVNLARPDVPSALAHVIARALERDPDHRFQTASELLVALEQACEQSEIHHSAVKLRQEVLACCGAPPAMEFDAPEEFLAPPGAPARQLTEPPPIPGDVFAAENTGINGVFADENLVHYLRVAGINITPEFLDRLTPSAKRIKKIPAES